MGIKKMSPEEFKATLAELGWRSADFCRKSGVERSTPSRWINEKTPIPTWVKAYLGAMLDIKRLHAKYIETRSTDQV
jgi:hypothetical protein